MKASVKWCEEMTFLGLSNSGHRLVMDGNAGETAPSPMEMVLIGAGGCSSVDVVSSLKAQNQPVEACEVLLSGTRRDPSPRLFTKINLHFIVTGALDDACVAKAVLESLEKYCSVCLMLGKGVEMTHSYEIVKG